MNQTTKIAWIGAGMMGSRMAANLAKAGFAVTVWNRTTPSPGLEFAASHGCAIARDAQEALSDSSIVCSCVTDGPALWSVLFAPDRDLKRLVRENALLVDFSTIGPVEAQRIAGELRGLGLRFLDAPVTGGDVGARDATLTFMIGGAGEDLDSIRPLLNVMGRKVVHAGPVGAGQSLKLVNQLLCGVNLLAVVEAFKVATALGMDPGLVVEACGSGAAGSWQLVNLGPKIIAGDDHPGFRAEHLLKDLRFLQEAIAAVTSGANPPCFDLALAAFERLCNAGQGSLGTQTVWRAHPG